jgi:hypothetical protein
LIPRGSATISQAAAVRGPGDDRKHPVERRVPLEKLDALYGDALRDTIRCFEEIGSPVISDGKQAKPSFATYRIHGLSNVAAGGIVVPSADAHTRRLPRLISASLLSFLYP